MKYAVVYVDTNEIYQIFDSLPEASYCVTDVFGPEWHTVTIKEIPSDTKIIYHGEG